MLTIQNTMRELWLARGEVTYFAQRLEAAGHIEEARELAQAGYIVGRALLELSDLVDERRDLIDAASKGKP
ncbi:hypothetical protein [Halomonas sp. PGE1]|uniref:hypothetical protein n=1 Tax=Halomonas sp. PGE1 TaxID=2730360 RepID=UPI001473FCA4|nr:hypothetical protein [Halomonas sp. PGE1]QJQ98215.1 hypothetical protein HIR79_05620 [Halomonas sp. PGE1]